MATIGIDFKIKMIQSGAQRIKLQLWDTAGQERFQTITASYYKGAKGVLLVYDSTRRSTFESVISWLKKIDDNAEYGTLKVLVANKIDVPTLEVPVSEGQALAKQHNLEFYSTSARSGENVESMFEGTCASVISQQMLAEERKEKEKVSLKPPKKGKKKV